MHFPRDLTNQELIDVYTLLPQAIAVYVTDQIIIRHASDAMISFWGKDRSVVGKPLEEAVPELKGQPFIGLLQKVFRTGITETGVAAPAKLMTDGVLQTHYYDYEYRAVKNEAGETYCILHTAKDVTQLILHKSALEEAKEKDLQLAREQLLNEELASSNEELNLINNELQQAQVNLVELNNELEERVKNRTQELVKSEARARFLLSDAPVSIGVFTGPDHIIESANTMILDVWGKTRQVIGKPIREALPELEGQPIFETLDEVYTSGRPFNGNEVKTLIEHDGIEEEVYSNFVYHPLKDEEGNTTGVMLVAIIVTEQVKARHKLDEFLSIASHELKTPLTSIKAFNQLMLKTSDGTRLKEFLKKTGENIYSLEKLISDLLDVTKINAGKMNYNMELFSFRRMLEESIENVQHTTANHKVILEHVEDVYYTGDQFRLAQVMQNLLSNAIKYSPAAEKVIVNSKIEQGNIVVSVQDFGISFFL
ncbi:MAG: PAS domain-containing protein, partial [Sphingobacteriales bacterium]